MPKLCIWLLPIIAYEYATAQVSKMTFLFGSDLALVVLIFRHSKLGTTANARIMQISPRKYFAVRIVISWSDCDVHVLYGQQLETRSASRFCLLGLHISPPDGIRLFPYFCCD